MRKKIMVKNGFGLLVRENRRIFLLLAFILGALLLTLGIALAYFSGMDGVEGNQVRLATMNLELSDGNGNAALPMDTMEVYPGWSQSMEGQVRNTGTADLVFRFQMTEGNADFWEVARAMNYGLLVMDEGRNQVYLVSGSLDDFNPENELMNLPINPGQVYNYCLTLLVPEDMDDHTTPENEDDNSYQGKEMLFDLAIQSTQVGNEGWEGFSGTL